MDRNNVQIDNSNNINNNNNSKNINNNKNNTWKTQTKASNAGAWWIILFLRITERKKRFFKSFFRLRET